MISCFIHFSWGVQKHCVNKTPQKIIATSEDPEATDSSGPMAVPDNGYWDPHDDAEYVEKRV